MIKGTPSHLSVPEIIMHTCNLVGCEKTFPQEEGFSIMCGYPCPGKGYPSIPCDQHWACCHDHAVAIGHACIDEHLARGNHG